MSCIPHPSDSPLVVTHRRREQIPTLDQENDRSSPIDDKKCAIVVRNLYKRYDGGPPILEDLCMKVHRGTIYGLLGSSGCGKTTLLSCIVGLRKWDAGEVLVYGHKPGTKESGIPGKRLGYMPQDLALYEQLTVREMIQFYSRLYNMSRSEATERWIFLVKLLKLPSKFNLIGNLSGGQKRRASLALALVHCPDLLILDEPTVGLDPVLRRSIWSHLYKIVSTLNTTIIVTTHYIEESRLAHSIGVMRRGRLLVEDSPANLLANFQCDLLEDVVLRLCHQDEHHNAANSKPPGGNKNTQLTFKSPWREVQLSNVMSTDEIAGYFRKAVGFDVELSQNLRRRTSYRFQRRGSSFFQKVQGNPLIESAQRIYGFTLVMWLTFIRHPVFIFLLLLAPSFNGTLSILTFGKPPFDMRFGVVNLEQPDWMTKCATTNNRTGKCDVSNLSCSFLRQLQKSPTFDLFPHSSEEEAIAEVHQGRSWGFISFPVNFSQNTVDMIAARQFALNESIEGSRIPVRLDVTQFAGAVLMTKELFASYAEYLRDVASSCGIGGRETDLPLFFREPVYGNNDDNFTEFMLPGLIVCVVFAVGCCLTAVLLVSDRRAGMLSRAYVTGLGNVEVMLSHAITQGSAILLQVGLWTLMMRLFGFVILGSGWLYIGILLLVGVCGAVFGILLGALCNSEVEILIISVVFLPLLMTYGGIIWPQEGFSPTVRVFADLIPSSLSVTSLRSVMTRGVGLTHAFVWPGIANLLSWLVVAWVVSVFAIRKITKQ